MVAHADEYTASVRIVDRALPASDSHEHGKHPELGAPSIRHDPQGINAFRVKQGDGAMTGYWLLNGEIGPKLIKERLDFQACAPVGAVVEIIGTAALSRAGTDRRLRKTLSDTSRIIKSFPLGKLIHVCIAINPGRSRKQASRGPHTGLISKEVEEALVLENRRVLGRLVHVALELRDEQQLREKPHIEVAGDRQVVTMPGIGNLLAIVLDIEVVNGPILAIG